MSDSRTRDISHPPQILSRAWYEATIEDFLQTSPDTILGQLTRHSGYSLLATETTAWLAEIDFLKSALEGISGAIFVEFNIPRMGRRIDALLLIGPVIFVIEFKVGEDRFERAALDQVWDYALDLKYFHQASHSTPIIPMLIATNAKSSPSFSLLPAADNVYRPLCVHAACFNKVIIATLHSIHGQPIDPREWSSAPYQPAPTIIEAARALYANHSVEALARHDAGAQNLAITSRRVEQLVDAARERGRKIICFITGVPGAGKTLVGMNIATQRSDRRQPTHAVFLSGNGPLVAVLREALTRDEVVRQKQQGHKPRKGEIGEKVKAFIQNVHHFRDDALIDPRPPADHVVIFDEAQRAWNLQKTMDFMRRRRHLDFHQSEPEFLISCMERHQDWAVIVCLVGGGQEIHTGEAGIDAWLDAVNAHFPNWDMYVSSRLTDSEYAAGKALDAVRDRANTHFDDALHLAVSLRSFRAENVSAFVKALLDCEKHRARESYAALADRYPIAVTRSLPLAKNWIRANARGTERFGLIASSKAQRLKPHAIDIRVDINPVHWFLNSKDDTRSSYYLEDAATEFQVQGLELDWACVTWDGDLRFTGKGWSFHDFRGDRWCNIANQANRRYLRNAYRVLLTRARQGMVIFVPPGDPCDPTRLPEYYDLTYHYLTEIGIPALT